MIRRTGRRPGKPDTRKAVLAAAREAFADKGFDGASIRAIATSAGVDPALVHHYYGTKHKLFLAAMRAPADPVDLLPQAINGPRDEVGARLVRLILNVWDSPTGAAALAVLRSAMNRDWTARLMREFIVTQVLRRAFAHLGLDEQELPLRTGLVITQMVGLAIARYVLKVEPIASAPTEQMVAAIGPTIQSYLTGPLPGGLPLGTRERTR